MANDLLPGEGLPRVLHEHLHDGVFHLGQLDTLAVLRQGAVAGVQQEGLLIDLPRLLRGRAPRPWRS